MYKICVVNSMQNVVVKDLYIGARIGRYEHKTASVEEAESSQGVLNKVNVLFKSVFDFFVTMFY